MLSPRVSRFYRDSNFYKGMVEVVINITDDPGNTSFRSLNSKLFYLVLPHRKVNPKHPLIKTYPSMCKLTGRS